MKHKLLASRHISYFFQKCKKGKPCEMDLPILKKRYRPDTINLFYVCADNSGHLHHVDRLAFFQICKVSDLARFAFGFCVFEDREQTRISHNELACVLRFSIFSLCLKFIRFNIVP